MGMLGTFTHGPALLYPALSLKNWFMSMHLFILDPSVKLLTETIRVVKYTQTTFCSSQSCLESKEAAYRPLCKPIVVLKGTCSFYPVRSACSFLMRLVCNHNEQSTRKSFEELLAIDLCKECFSQWAVQFTQVKNSPFKYHFCNTWWKRPSAIH